MKSKWHPSINKLTQTIFFEEMGSVTLNRDHSQASKFHLHDTFVGKSTTRNLFQLQNVKELTNSIKLQKMKRKSHDGLSKIKSTTTPLQQMTDRGTTCCLSDSKSTTLICFCT